QPAGGVAPPGETVSEGAATGDLVGMTAASSSVSGGSVTFSLSDDAGGRFAINGSTGVVTVANGSLLDYESAPGHQYSITVVASDGKIGRASCRESGVTAVAAGQPNDSVAPTGGTVSGGAGPHAMLASDSSSGVCSSDLVTFSLSDDAGGRFAINGSTGVVTVANGSLLDYESAPGHQYSITVVASDGTLTSSDRKSVV